jgi:methanogenic corrinoid protein MtbC1
VSAGEAAQRIASQATDREPVVPVESHFDGRILALKNALESYEEAGAHAVIDQLLMEFDGESVMRSVFLPLLAEIGELWERGRLTVAQEHFASNLIRRRLGAMARGWENGSGPRALLACPQDEEHDIPLIMFGIALGNRGWRVTYLGQRTPTQDLLNAMAALHPGAVVLASPFSQAFDELVQPLRAVSGDVRIAIGGAGATAGVAGRMGASLLAGDPVSAAAQVAIAGLPKVQPS